MSKKAAEQHQRAADHHSSAAKHHAEAAKHHEVGIMKKRLTTRIWHMRIQSMRPSTPAMRQSPTSTNTAGNNYRS